MRLAEHLSVERAGRVARIALDRPEALNALTLPMIAALHQTLDELAEDGDTRVVVLTGRGRAFCAGADLTALGDDPRPALEAIQALVLRMRELPLPIVAAVNGITMAGGLELVLACDVPIATESARIGDGHANVGVIPGAGTATLLPRVIGAAAARYLLFTGRTLPARELLRMGLLAVVLEDDEFEAGVTAIAESIAGKSPLGLRVMKRLVAEGLQETSVAAALELELEANDSYASSHDMSEGVAAFAEGRPPEFLGR